jgi:hypothetical protein
VARSEGCFFLSFEGYGACRLAPALPLPQREEKVGWGVRGGYFFFLGWHMPDEWHLQDMRSDWSAKSKRRKRRGQKRGKRR